MKPKITPFDIVKVKKTKNGLFVVPRYDFRELYVEEKPLKRKR